MFSIFKSNPVDKMKKQYALKLEKAMLSQRNGDIRSYSLLTFEADALYKEILRLEAERDKA